MPVDDDEIELRELEAILLQLDQEEEDEVQRQEKKAPEEKVEADVEATTAFPPTAEPFGLSTGSAGAPQ